MKNELTTTNNELEEMAKRLFSLTEEMKRIQIEQRKLQEDIHQATIDLYIEHDPVTSSKRDLELTLSNCKLFLYVRKFLWTKGISVQNTDIRISPWPSE